MMRESTPAYFGRLLVFLQVEAVVSRRHDACSVAGLIGVASPEFTLETRKCYTINE